MFCSIEACGFLLLCTPYNILNNETLILGHVTMDSVHRIWEEEAMNSRSQIFSTEDDMHIGSMLYNMLHALVVIRRALDRSGTREVCRYKA